MATQIPLVDYLQLGDPPHLTAHECTACGARFFDRRNACAACGSQLGFATVALTGEGTLETFTIVTVAAPGVPVPYVAGLIDLAGTSVRANIVNVPAEPDRFQLGMKVRLTTFPLGTDRYGVEAIGFGFEPVERGVR